MPVMTPSRPSYRRPPVAEVALALYVSPPLPLRTVSLGRLWERWRDRYPQSEDQPPLPPVMPETFPHPSPSASIQFSGVFPGVRVWYLSEGRDRVLQVQRDRLVLNWRRLADDQPYPRYESLRPEFEAAAVQFLEFATSEGLGPARIAQVEVAYVNPIPLGDRVEDPARMLSVWSGERSDDFLPASPESVSLALRYRIPHPETGEPIGRLYVEASPAMHQNVASPEEEVFLLRLFARGRPLGDGITGALAFLDVGRDWVVRGFTSITTSEMHDIWELEE